MVLAQKKSENVLNCIGSVVIEAAQEAKFVITVSICTFLNIKRWIRIKQ